MSTALAGVVGETVNAEATGSCSVKTVQAVEQSSIDERGAGEQPQQGIRSSHLLAVAVQGKVAAVVIILLTEPTLIDFRVQGREEQVLQHGAVIGVAAGLVVAFQQLPHLVLSEQVFG